MNKPSNDAQNLIQRHQMVWPIKVSAIANDLGITVLASSLPHNISGSLSLGKDEKWIIKINRHEVKERQRFTAAHEIAHYLLHKDKIGNEIEDNTLYRSTKLSDELEWEANRLAADILMPWELVRRAIDEGIRTPEELARKFEVSEVAMKIRLGLPT
jgi:Zn-dependent peptidase ImmA (M78 family)